MTPRPPSRVSRWLARWGGIAPLLGAEFVVWIGFGALLPVMPLYFTDTGVGVETLGLVIAAWPAARLAAEPIFGWLADRVARVPLMVAGLVVGALAIGGSLAVDSALAFLGLRALAGLGAAMYDPAARGYITDGTPPARRGEAFGLYGAAQMGGLLLGPAIGGLGAAAFGGVSFVFWFGAIASAVAAVVIAVRVRELPRLDGARVPPAIEGFGEYPPEGPGVARGAAAAIEDEDGAAAGATPPERLRNPWLLAAIAINIGGFFAGGVYEVIWSLFLDGRGASLEFIGLTFAAFGLPVLVLAPAFGRLIDKRGPYPFAVAGSLLMGGASIIYPFLPDTRLVIPVILAEGTGFAMLSPALFAFVALGSPRGRSSTAQGIFGAAGTAGTILAAAAAGYLAAIDIAYPFFAAGIATGALLALGLVLGGRTIRAGGSPASGAIAPEVA
jgi:MFS family permease